MHQLDNKVFDAADTRCNHEECQIRIYVSRYRKNFKTTPGKFFFHCNNNFAVL